MGISINTTIIIIKISTIIDIITTILIIFLRSEWKYENKSTTDSHREYMKSTGPGIQVPFQQENWLEWIMRQYSDPAWSEKYTIFDMNYNLLYDICVIYKTYFKIETVIFTD